MDATLCGGTHIRKALQSCQEDTHIGKWFGFVSHHSHKSWGDSLRRLIENSTWDDNDDNDDGSGGNDTDEEADHEIWCSVCMLKLVLALSIDISMAVLVIHQ